MKEKQELLKAKEEGFDEMGRLQNDKVRQLEEERAIYIQKFERRKDGS